MRKMANKTTYQKLLSELKFEERSVFKRNKKKDSYVLIGEINRRDVLLKIIPKSDTSRVENLKKEALVDSVIDKHNSDIELPLIIKANVLKTGIFGKYFWQLRSYYPGNSLAITSRSKPLLGYDILRGKYKDKPVKIVPKIVDNLISLQSLTTDFRKYAVKKDTFKKKYFVDIEDYRISAIEKDFSISLASQIEFFNSVKNDYYNKSNIKACIGDFSPSNILIKNDGLLIFSDFEQFHFDNYTIDAVYLWLFLWRHNDWQKELLDKYFTNEAHREFFRASIIRILLHMLRWPSLSIKINDQQEALRYDKNHIWFKYLVAAGESFKAIMKVK